MLGGINRKSSGATFGATLYRDSVLFRASGCACGYLVHLLVYRVLIQHRARLLARVPFPIFGP